MEEAKVGLCHGQHACLTPSASGDLGVPAKFIYYFRRIGVAATLKRALRKALRLAGLGGAREEASARVRKTVPAAEEVLNLQPGELVEVKSWEEICATLDQPRAGHGRHKGLLFMTPMANFCGQRFRVYKRLNRMLLEATGEVKTIKNTVLLEGVQCDGKDFYDCDRSCYHFWREAWLRRVQQ